MKPINIVVIGFGGMGSYHARELMQLEDGICAYGAYDILPERLEDAKKLGLKVFDSLENVLTDPAVEAILIATPNDSHKEIAIQALKAGKHVISEKPVMMNTSELDEVLDVAKQCEKIFMTHQNRRWDEDFLIIRNLYQHHQIGELFHLESRVHGANGIPGDWRHLKVHGGGMLLDWGVHLLDQLLFLVDSPIESVYADLSYVLGDEVDDGFMTHITFKNGVKSLIEVGTSNFIKLPRWYVKGFEGAAIIEDWDLTGKVVKQTGHIDHHQLTPIQAGQGLTKTMAPPSEEAVSTLVLPEPLCDYDSFYANFYAVVRENATPIVKNEEVRRVLALIETIFESAATKSVIHF